MTSNNIRQAFLDYFASKNHQIVDSAPIVLKNDPTLLFTNAGMNQFKDYFLGHDTPKHHRIADTQKCLRVSGKHNDLEEVGKDTYHHTMFEMLGNWSFGDYFKKDAIAWAWELLTEVYGIEKDRLYVTIFEGSDEDGLGKDEEAYNFWKAIVPEERILLGSKKDNFWEMGDQGPCGPCSEIHVDIRDLEDRQKLDGATLVNQDHPQVVEIWNLVFIEFNRKADGKLESLPEKHVDTGMGFERLCMVLQGKQSNYDTDVFTPLIAEVESIASKQYGSDEPTDIAMRVIADHVRAVAFAIADGQLPSNTGAGYVIRRILRRAIRYGFTFLDLHQPFIHCLVPTLSKQLSATFPELKLQNDLIINVIREEEQSFLHTLEQGLNLLEELIKNSDGKRISGVKAFELFDTYGFPKDLTALILSERHMTFDEEEFNTEMTKQKERSRAASATSADDWVILNDSTSEGFVGYDTLEADVTILKYRKISTKKDGDQYQIVLNKTPFYAESGGQMGDTGVLTYDDKVVSRIIDTKKENNLIVHLTKTLPQPVEATFKAVVNHSNRVLTARNHSATHLLHQALRHVLGNHVEQKGSAVYAKGLRFDFSHFAKLTPDELKAVETFVNDKIAQSIPLTEHRDVSIEDAKKTGAMMLFGEKYGDRVRMIQFNDSIELCGGTHVPNTGDIWYFKIVSESAIAAGVRRIEAITSQEAQKYLSKSQEAYEAVKSLLKNPKDPVKAVASLQTEVQDLKKALEKLQKAQAKNAVNDLNDQLTAVNGVNTLITQMDLDPKGIKDILFHLGSKHDDLFAIITSAHQGKPSISCYISKPLTESKNLNAGNIVRTLAKHIQGGGGGQAFFATAGGKNPDGLSKVLTEAKALLN
ncbi:MAG: alanine--tRNA ligase [Flavobacteriia bacterium]|nr:MAG: alanine--tRNA ligase [Flavobacteriia bacterium]